MEAYKQEFIEFMVESDVLKFGEFTLKSGRKSPFFMNAGAYVTGDQLHRLGLYYAQAMVEDVTTSGKSIEETYPIITSQAKVKVKGLMVSLNRMEVGKGGKMCALDEVSERYSFPTASIVSMEEVTEHLYNRECQGRVVINDEIKAAIDAYYKEYGAKK